VNNEVKVNGLSATVIANNYSRSVDLACGANVIEVVATDNAGRVTSITRNVTRTCASAVYTVRYLQPLDESNYAFGTTEAKTVMNNAKAGRVIPVKINVYDGSTKLTNAQIADGRLTIRVSEQSSCNADATDAIETYAEAAGSSNYTSNFRWDSMLGGWIYNLDTGNKTYMFAVNKCYKIDVYLDGTTKISTPYYAVVKIAK